MRRTESLRPLASDSARECPDLPYNGHIMGYSVQGDVSLYIGRVNKADLSPAGWNIQLKMPPPIVLPTFSPTGCISKHKGAPQDGHPSMESGPDATMPKSPMIGAYRIISYPNFTFS